jgi:hypothetical protein
MRMGLAALIKIPMDESGVHDNSPVLTVAAYLARREQWQDWTKRWNLAKRPIKVFHSVDCANLKGEFRDWSPKDRDALVIRLLKVINESDFPGIVIGIQMDEFRAAMAGRDDLRKLFGEPYSACFQWVTQAIMNIADDLGSGERIGFIHEKNDYKREAEDAFAWVKANGNPRGTNISLAFEDKAKYVPLQAADALAYEGNKRMREPARDARRSWLALNPDGRIIAAHYGRENMYELIDRLEKIREGRFGEIDFGSGWNRAHFRIGSEDDHGTGPA